MTETSAFLGLFLSAFLAATLLPAQSELNLGYLVIKSDYSIALLVIVASIGNTAGAIINWIIGRGISKSVVRMKKINKSTRYRTIANWYNKYGQWTLLLSWAPFIGDPITVFAGIFKVPIKTFVLFVAVAKSSRYVVIAMFAKKFALGPQNGAVLLNVKFLGGSYML